MHDHEKINYVEFPAKDLQATKGFFTQAFGWVFEDFGPEYAAFSKGLQENRLCHSNGVKMRAC